MLKEKNDQENQCFRSKFLEIFAGFISIFLNDLKGVVLKKLYLWKMQCWY